MHHSRQQGRIGRSISSRARACSFQGSSSVLTIVCYHRSFLRYHISTSVQRTSGGWLTASTFEKQTGEQQQLPVGFLVCSTGAFSLMALERLLDSRLDTAASKIKQAEPLSEQAEDSEYRNWDQAEYVGNNCNSFCLGGFHPRYRQQQTCYNRDVILTYHPWSDRNTYEYCHHGQHKERSKPREIYGECGQHCGCRENAASLSQE